MQKIQIIAVGKIKEKFLQEAFAEYKKRLSTLCALTVTEISPAYLPERPSSAQIDSALEAEGKKILSAVPNGAFVVPMCIEGKQLGSTELAEMINEKAMTHPCISFIIGSSHGLSNEVKAAAGYRLSISKMTFPHDLARVMLSEQIYRGFKILSGGTYHK